MFLFFVKTVDLWFWRNAHDQYINPLARPLLIALQVVRTSFAFQLRECMGSSSPPPPLGRIFSSPVKIIVWPITDNFRTNGKRSLTSEISRLSLSAFIKKTSKVMASSLGISRCADLVSVDEFPEGHGNENNRKKIKRISLCWRIFWR